tara:strand:- start:1672 stop:1899 length:228 start_codon:yes stop_codon:yes gene_type:complete
MLICTEANIDTNVDIEFDLDLDNLDIETTVNDQVKQLLEDYISDPEGACSIGIRFEDAIRVVVQRIMAGERRSPC